MPETIKAGDTKPPLRYQLLGTDGSPINLELCAVTLHMIHLHSQKKIRKACEIVDEQEGRVRYQWQTGDTDVPGKYRIEFLVEFPDFRELTVPNDGFESLKIIRSLREDEGA